jgi:predicted LPLAT superfamily acyltransferase
MSDARAPHEWMQREERGNLFWLHVMRWLSLRLGRRVSRVVLYGIALYFVLVASQAREASRQYLARALGRRPGWRDLYRHVLTFATTVHDRIYLLNDRFDLFDVRCTGREDVDRLADDARQGLLLFGAHLGSFEVLRAMARHDPRLHVSIAMYMENARQINAVLAALNPQAQPDIIPLGRLDSLLALHGRLKGGGTVGLLADRAVASDQYVWLPFLGQPAPFPTGPFRLAVLLRQPLFFMTGLYQGGDRYDLHFEPLADFSSLAARDREALIPALMARYVALLEQHCRAAPYNWFNFYDFWGAHASVHA